MTVLEPVVDEDKVVDEEHRKKTVEKDYKMILCGSTNSQLLNRPDMGCV